MKTSGTNIIYLVNYLQDKIPELEKKYWSYRKNGERCGFWPYRLPEIIFIENVLVMAGRLPGESEAA